MAHLLDEILSEAANGSPATVALSAESVAVLLFASGFIDQRENWLDREYDPLDEVTDADWDEIEKLVGNAYRAIMTPLVGQILPIMLATVPDNMLLCDGANYLRDDYPDLYAALDAAFIVDADNFVVPDLMSRIIIGAGHGSGLSNYNVNAQGGEEQHTLSQIEMPAHAHTLNDPGHTHNIKTRTGGTAGGNNILVVGVANVAETPVLKASESKVTGITMDNSGSGNGHNNIQPYTALKYAVVAY